MTSNKRSRYHESDLPVVNPSPVHSSTTPCKRFEHYQERDPSVSNSSPVINSTPPQKRTLPPSLSPSASPKQAPVRRKYTHKGYYTICTTCIRCRTTGIKCDGEHPCERCKWKEADCVYKWKSTEKCLRCREKNIKCDREFPCSKCAVRRIQCVFEDEPPDAKKILVVSPEPRSLTVSPEQDTGAKTVVKQETITSPPASPGRAFIASTLEILTGAEAVQ